MEEKTKEQILKEAYRGNLRDKFAMAALTGMLSRIDVLKNSDDDDEDIAACAYELVDVMLDARGE